MTKKTDMKVDVEFGVNAKGKPFYQRTEFWKSMVAHVIALLLIAIGTYKGNDDLVGVGAIVLAVSGGAYSVSRGMEKKGLAETAAEAVKAVAKNSWGSDFLKRKN